MWRCRVSNKADSSRVGFLSSRAVEVAVPHPPTPPGSPKGYLPRERSAGERGQVQGNGVEERWREARQ